MNIKGKSSLYSGAMGWMGLALGLFFSVAMATLWTGSDPVSDADRDARATLQASLLDR
jgi:hypothetical protein